MLSVVPGVSIFLYAHATDMRARRQVGGGGAAQEPLRRSARLPSQPWEPLRVYLNDGRLPLDNNDVQQLMKQVALGRKNWLFIGSVAAGQRAADFLSLVSSAVRNDLDVRAYLKDVLDQLLAGSTDYHALRPDVRKQSHAEAVRIYRTEERRDRADRKQRRRARRRTPCAAVTVHPASLSPAKPSRTPGPHRPKWCSWALTRVLLSENEPRVGAGEKRLRPGQHWGRVPTT